jgi:hypothetical protein
MATTIDSITFFSIIDYGPGTKISGDILYTPGGKEVGKLSPELSEIFPDGTYVDPSKGLVPGTFSSPEAEKKYKDKLFLDFEEKKEKEKTAEASGITESDVPKTTGDESLKTAEVREPSSKKYKVGHLKNVGNLLRFSETADPYGYTNSKFERSMKVVDLIPVNFSYDLTSLGNPKDAKTIVRYYFDKAIEEYAYVTGKYGLTPYYGVRAWLTSETTSMDVISNNYTGNVISDGINNLTNVAMAPVRSLSLSSGGTPEDFARTLMSTGVGEMVSGVASSAGSFLSGMFGEGFSETVGNIASLAGSVVAYGKHISLPDIWNSSSYSPNLSLNIKLTSPYGDPEAIKKYVLEPLCYLIILTSPRTRDGITYGYAPYVHVKAYGLTNMNIAVIDRLSWIRGSGMINNCRQPLSIDVVMDLRPAVPGFAVMEGSPNIKVDIANSSFNDPYEIYPDNTSGGVTLLDNVINSFRPIPADISSITGAKCPGPPGGSLFSGFRDNPALGLGSDFFSGESPYFSSVFSAIEKITVSDFVSAKDAILPESLDISELLGVAKKATTETLATIEKSVSEAITTEVTGSPAYKTATEVMTSIKEGVGTVLESPAVSSFLKSTKETSKTFVDEIIKIYPKITEEERSRIIESVSERVEAEGSAIISGSATAYEAATSYASRIIKTTDAVLAESFSAERRAEIGLTASSLASAYGSTVSKLKESVVSRAVESFGATTAAVSGLISSAKPKTRE